MTRLVILGAGGHGRVVADAAQAAGTWTDIVFADDRWPEVQSSGSWKVCTTVKGYVDGPHNGDDAAIVAIGNNALRLAILDRLIKQGCRVATVLHPRAIISPSARVADGTVVCAGAILNPDCNIGRAVIVNTGAIVEHDCSLGDAVHAAPGVKMAGGVQVGDRTWLGIGCTIVENTRIGVDTIVGAGAVVVRDVASRVTVVGVPARNLAS